MPEYLILTIYKTGKYYKPMVLVPNGKAMKAYKLFTASEQGFLTRERAHTEGEIALRCGRFL